MCYTSEQDKEKGKLRNVSVEPCGVQRRLEKATCSVLALLNLLKPEQKLCEKRDNRNNIILL